MDNLSFALSLMLIDDERRVRNHLRRTLEDCGGIEIIGEAVKKIPNERREEYPDIPWKSIAGMKDMLVHEYWQVDVAVVCATVQHSLPSLKAVVIKELQGMLGSNFSP